ARRARQVRVQIQAQAMKDGGNDFLGGDRAFGGGTADVVTFADHPTAFDTTAGEVDRPALRPMVAAAGGISARRSAAFWKGCGRIRKGRRPTSGQAGRARRGLR